MSSGLSNGINGTMGWCARCGEANPYTSLVCASCGSRLPWATPAPRLLPGEDDIEPVAPGMHGLLQTSGNAPATGSAYALTPTTVLPASPTTAAAPPLHHWRGEEDRATPPCPVCSNLSTRLINTLCTAQQWPESQLVSAGHQHRWHPGQAWPATDAPQATNPEGRAENTVPSEATTRTSAELERLLAPPPMPALEHHGAFYAGAVLTSGGLLCLPFTLVLGDWLPGLAHVVNLLVNTLCFGAAGSLFLVSFLTSSRARARYDEQRQQWESQMQKWMILRYCERCDNVFNPATNQATRPSYLRSLL